MEITNTPEQERDLDFAPDGRSLIYSSERDGLWQVYMSSIVNENEKLFPYSTELKEECVTNSDKVSFQPLFSPDGKEIAFLENRTAIRVINLDTKEVRTVMDGKYQWTASTSTPIRTGTSGTSGRLTASGYYPTVSS